MGSLEHSIAASRRACGARRTADRPSSLALREGLSLGFWTSNQRTARTRGHGPEAGTLRVRTRAQQREPSASPTGWDTGHEGAEHLLGELARLVQTKQPSAR